MLRLQASPQNPEPRDLEEAGDSRRPAGTTGWLRRLLAIFTLIISGSGQSPGGFEGGQTRTGRGQVRIFWIHLFTHRRVSGNGKSK